MRRVPDLSLLLQGHSLSEKAAADIFSGVFSGEMELREVKTLLLLLAQKGESAEEIAGCIKALRKLEPPAQTNLPKLMDLCGTGGDGSGSFNISTVSAFVAAGAGVRVAKHGNRSVSSRCGSSDLMEALGVRLETRLESQKACLAQAGIAYFHAPFFHPVFSKFQLLRKALGVRTLFNHLGPLVNPLILSAQMIGVAKPSYVSIIAKSLQSTGIREGLVCHSDDGLDELSPGAPSSAARISAKKISMLRIHPGRYGFKKCTTTALRGGTCDDNRLTALQILQGKLEGPKRDAVLLNAGAAIWIFGLAQDLGEGIERAKESIDQGLAYQNLLDLIRMTQQNELSKAS